MKHILYTVFAKDKSVTGWNKSTPTEDLEEAKRLAEMLKRMGHTVVVTEGVFDTRHDLLNLPQEAPKQFGGSDCECPACALAEREHKASNPDSK